MSAARKQWPLKRIGELATVARGSSPRPIADQRYFEGGDIPWIKIADATKSGKYLYQTKEHVNEYGASFSRRLPIGSLIVAASGTLGYTQMLGISGCVHDGWLYLTDFRGVDKHYLYYFFQWKKEHFYNSAYGAAIQNINTEILRETDIALPPLPVQQRIASILSAYDDLIENNTRRIENLEEMAQMLYREWFVNFRFPGHEQVRMVESELGSIPKGWTVCGLKDVTSFISRGISPTYDDSADGWIINQKCIRDRRLNLGPARRQSKPVPSEKVVRKGDILINSTGVGTLGRVAQVQHEVSNITVDSHVTIVRPSQHPDYIGEVAFELEPTFEAMGVGSTGQTELGRERIGGIMFVCPPEPLQSAFSGHASPLHQLVVLLLGKNENLRATRDFLLPKLISGEIPVEAAEEAAAELVAQPA